MYPSSTVKSDTNIFLFIIYIILRIQPMGSTLLHNFMCTYMCTYFCVYMQGVILSDGSSP